METGPPTDPAFDPARNEEEILLNPANSPELEFHWDLAGRIRKLGMLVVAPRRLFAELSEAPDIFTPLLFLTLLGLVYLFAVQSRLYPLILAGMRDYVAHIPASQLNDEQRAGFPEALAGLTLWEAAAIGINHVIRCGVYAVVLYWLASYLGFQPKEWPRFLSILCFVWLPRQVYTVVVAFVLIQTQHWDSFPAFAHRLAELSPGLHLLLPEQMPFDQYWALAAFYLAGPIDLFLVLSAIWIWMAAPALLNRPDRPWRLVAVATIIFILIGAAELRVHFPPDQLQASMAPPPAQPTPAP